LSKEEIVEFHSLLLLNIQRSPKHLRKSARDGKRCWREDQKLAISRVQKYHKPIEEVKL